MITRRRFLIGAGVVGGGLAVGFALKSSPPVPNTIEGTFQPNAWLQITPEGGVIFQLDKTEMGQGVMTSMTTCIAEELDYDPKNIQVEFAGVHPAFTNSAMGVQLTGASTSTITTWDSLREAGATTRALLLAAAAKKWGTDADKLRTDNGTVTDGAGKSMGYGELAETASKMSVGSAALKKPDEYKWIGKSVPRLDVPDKSKGKANFGVDVPADLVAVVVRCPHFGGSLDHYEPDSVSSMEGVKSVFPIHSGVAIVATGYWPARKAANALNVTWNKGPLAGLDSAGIRKQQEAALVDNSPVNQLNEGDAEASYEVSDHQISAKYSAPYFHHSPMEPQNTTALVQGETCELWSPSQGPGIAQAVVAHFTGLDRNNIKVNTTLLGGGFGRRGYVDFTGEAGAIAKQMPGKKIKLMWSREDDMRHDFYRPGTLHGVKAAFDENGNITSWQHDLVSTSIVQGFGVDLFSTILPSWVPTDMARSFSRGSVDLIAKYDPTMAEGALIPYDIPNARVGAILHDPGIRTGFWRSVGHSHNGFVVESFIDECAHAAKKDPAEFRRNLLKEHPRHIGVLDKVVEMSNWGKTDKVQGIAVHKSFESFVAQVVEVTVKGDSYTVDKVYCATDCGIVVNPAIVEAQMESGIVYGLTAAMKPGVTFKDGATVESNFDDLPVLRMNEMPEIEVAIIQNKEFPGGVGEISVPPIAAALGNALYAATGQRLRDLPFKLNA